MKLPTVLSRRKPGVYKNQFGHVLVLAGSKRMLGAAALTSLAAIRSGAGLVTVGIPESLNAVIQKKIDNVIMTLPLSETGKQTLSLSAFKAIQERYSEYSVIAIGPGLSQEASTKSLIRKVIATSLIPLVIDADALNALVEHEDVLLKTKTRKILTPHSGEMARLVKKSKEYVEENRIEIAKIFAKKYDCTLLLKGHQTVVATSKGEVYINHSGNAGMATAGSGDVLTGMIAAFVAQGLAAFEAAKYGAYLHGKAGDLAAKKQTRFCMIASDMINLIPQAVKGCEK